MLLAVGDYCGYFDLYHSVSDIPGSGTKSDFKKMVPQTPAGSHPHRSARSEKFTIVHFPFHHSLCGFLWAVLFYAEVFWY